MSVDDCELLIPSGTLTLRRAKQSCFTRVNRRTQWAMASSRSPEGCDVPHP